MRSPGSGRRRRPAADPSIDSRQSPMVVPSYPDRRSELRSIRSAIRDGLSIRRLASKCRKMASCIGVHDDRELHAALQAIESFQHLPSMQPLLCAPSFQLPSRSNSLRTFNVSWSSWAVHRPISFLRIASKSPLSLQADTSFDDSMVSSSCSSSWRIVRLARRCRSCCQTLRELEGLSVLDRHAASNHPGPPCAYDESLSCAALDADFQLLQHCSSR